MCIRDRYQRRVRGTNRAKMAAVRVAVLDGPGINPGCLHWSMQCLEQDQDILATVITPDQIKIPGSLDEFEVFYCPGGSHQGVFNLLGVNGREAIREFVSHGGGLVGICGGAYFIHRMELANIHVHGTNYATDVLHGAHGDAYLETLQGFAETYPTTEWGPESWLMFSSGPLMGPREAGVLCDDRCGIVEPIALFANDILGDMREQIEFLEQRLRETGLWVCLEEHGGDGPCENVSSHSNCHLCGEPKPKWHSTNLLVPEDKKPPVGLMPSTWAIVRSTFGMGKVIAMSPHPEFTEGKFEMLGSSIRWVRPAEDTPLMLGPEAVTPNSAQLAHASALCRVPSSIAEPEDDSVFGCAVEVRAECEHLELGVNLESLDFKSNVLFARCSVAGCNHVEQNMVCLSCGAVGCGRGSRAHSKAHFHETGHPLVVGLADMSYVSRSLRGCILLLLFLALFFIRVLPVVFPDCCCRCGVFRETVLLAVVLRV
eukprot:TRINITY_DN7289_c0_g1_i1.p1 TRINITY_DN7289_c0_g1~~TRINITY_DN7289_c0_g1_i1.p1  ORF type:complete len:485 (-),score=78.53 TRINITY_DN7289_c0_g1_i1:528-1982(-)